MRAIPGSRYQDTVLTQLNWARAILASVDLCLVHKPETSDHSYADHAAVSLNRGINTISRQAK